jgi:hypothetical protein
MRRRRPRPARATRRPRAGRATAPVEATAPVAESAGRGDCDNRGSLTGGIDRAGRSGFIETIEVEPAPFEPEAPTIPAAPPPRRVAAIAKDLFADVMALSEEERIALFT